MTTAAASTPLTICMEKVGQKTPESTRAMMPAPMASCAAAPAGRQQEQAAANHHEEDDRVETVVAQQAELQRAVGRRGGRNVEKT